ncbi:MAG: hypothetical protein ACOY94_23325 [Bacillota bacterium]
MDRRTQIERRLEEILRLWLRADRQQRNELLMERLRLQLELDSLSGHRSSKRIEGEYSSDV